MTHTIETLKEPHEQRFGAVEKAIILAAEEMSRRLDILNHAHEQAREKERDFIGREAFDTFVLRVADDFTILRRESQTAVLTTSGVRETAVKALTEGVTEQNTKNEMPCKSRKTISCARLPAIPQRTNHEHLSANQKINFRGPDCRCSSPSQSGAAGTIKPHPLSYRQKLVTA
jgi:hypothetical protein